MPWHPAPGCTGQDAAAPSPEARPMNRGIAVNMRGADLLAVFLGGLGRDPLLHIVLAQHVQHLASRVETRGGHCCWPHLSGRCQGLFLIGLEMMGRKSVSTLAPCDKLMVFLLPRNTCQKTRKRDERSWPACCGVEWGRDQNIPLAKAMLRADRKIFEVVQTWLHRRMNLNLCPKICCNCADQVQVPSCQASTCS